MIHSQVVPIVPVIRFIAFPPPTPGSKSESLIACDGHVLLCPLVWSSYLAFLCVSPCHFLNPEASYFVRMSFKSGLFCLIFLHDQIQDMHFWQKCHKREIYCIRRHLRIWPIIGNINFEKCILNYINKSRSNTNIDSYETIPKMDQIQKKLCHSESERILTLAPFDKQAGRSVRY